MISSVFLPSVKGYNISKLSGGKYAVAVNNGNMGACQMDKQQFDEFISKQKEQGNVSPSKATKVVIGTGIAIALTMGADYIFCKGKHVKGLWKALKGNKPNSEVKPDVKPNMDELDKAKQKVYPSKTKSKKHRNEHTTGYTASPITETKKSRDMQNLDMSHVNANQRKMVEQAELEIITPQQQEAYERSIAYQAPTKQQAEAIAKNNATNVAERAKENNLANNAKGGDRLAELKEKFENEVVEVPILENEIKGLQGTIKKLEQQIAGAKKMGKNTFRLDKILETNKSKLVEKQKALELAA